MKRSLRTLATATVVAGLSVLGPPLLPDTAMAAGQTRFVDCSAPANGDGTQASPINSMPEANKVAMRPGDRMVFKAGTTCLGQLWVRVPGTPSNRISYGSYGTSTGGSTRAHIEANGNPSAVWMSNAGSVTVENLELSAKGDNTTPRRGVWLQAIDSGDVTGVTLRGLDIHDVRGAMPSTTGGDSYVGKMAGASGGIVAEAVGSTKPSALVDLTIEDNTIHSVDRQGIYTWSNWCVRPELSNHWRTRCTGQWNPHRDTTVRGNRLDDVGGDGIALKTTSNALVERNTLDGFNVRSGSPNAGMWTANSDDVTFQHNTATHGRTTKDGMAYDVDHSTRRALFQYNVSANNEGGFFLICPYGQTVPGHSEDFVIRYNLSVNDHARTFQVCSGGVQNGQIYNNTIYLPENDAAHQILLESATADKAVQLDFRNNILLRGKGTGRLNWTYDDSAVVGSRNVFFNVPALPGATGNSTTDPRLARPAATVTDPAAYRPQSGSPVLGTGAAVPGAPQVDFFGTPITGAPSRGFAHASATS